ncbi:hypothetical protein PRIPAC_86052 [Pristionchus pacificus]|uniref:Uncharacterized protein n=1 Tax=Pristionchus pacificus TaxID=54126 RepID=A0A2A6BV50_PRIPA|nr:hypothetical protein PRIPAC_86052 [Pristionchus pacificus]|eukprot:PDM69737.1 hypothetical protein PRIPAC_44833 [Pristionchus pacificus]
MLRVSGRVGLGQSRMVGRSGSYYKNATAIPSMHTAPVSQSRIMRTRRNCSLIGPTEPDRPTILDCPSPTRPLTLNIEYPSRISPRWNTIVTDHLIDRPALKWFRWDNDNCWRTVLFRANQCEYFTHSHSAELCGLSSNQKCNVHNSNRGANHYRKGLSSTTFEMTSLNLATLPSDVIRIVVGNVGLLNFDDAKLLNRRPVIKWFRWDSDEFGSAVTFLATQRESFSHSHLEAQSTLKVIRLLSRCSKISKIELTMTHLEAIKSVLCNLPIGELTITGEDYRQPNSRALVLDFLRACDECAHPIKRLISSAVLYDRNLHAEFLIQCAKLAAEVVVVRSDSEPPRNDERFRFYFDLSSHMDYLKDELNNTHQVHAQLTNENNGWNTIYRLAIKSL